MAKTAFLVFDETVVDSARTNGQLIAVSPAVEVGDNNTGQLELRVLVQNATSLDIQAFESNDGHNWTPKGSEQNIDAVGFKKLTVDSTLTSRFIRYHASVTGTGKAIFSGDLHLSQQT